MSVAFLAARILHPLGMDGMKYGRPVGTTITFLLLLGLGLYAISLPLIARHDLAPKVIETVPAAG